MHRRKIASSFDDIVGKRKNGWRESEAERPCGLEIDDELKLSGLYNRQISGLHAIEDAGCVDADLAVCIGDARPIADQASLDRIFARPMLFSLCLTKSGHTPISPTDDRLENRVPAD